MIVRPNFGDVVIKNPWDQIRELEERITASVLIPPGMLAECKPRSWVEGHEMIREWSRFLDRVEAISTSAIQCSQCDGAGIVAIGGVPMICGPCKGTGRADP